MAGLDHSSMHGTDRDFVDFAALDTKERVGVRIKHDIRTCRGSVIGPMPPQRLEPWMADRHNGALLRDLTLEPLHLDAVWRECRIRLTDQRTRRAELSMRIVGKDRDESRVVRIFGHAEERDNSHAACDSVDHGVPKLVDGFIRDSPKWNRPPIPQA